MRGRVQPLVERRTFLVQGAAERAVEFLDDAETRLLDSGLPGLDVRRFDAGLRASLCHQPDVRQYVRVLPRGAHLEVEHASSIEPRGWKRGLAWVLTGDALAWSEPHGDGESEAHALVAIVRQAVLEAGRTLAERLEHAPATALEDVLREW